VVKNSGKAFNIHTIILWAGFLCLFMKFETGYAQAEEVMPLIKELRKGTSLPPAILSARTLVLVSPNQSNWQELAEKVHEIFPNNGIDAVAYYQLEEVFAGPDAQKEMIPGLLRRQFGNLALIIEEPNKEISLILTLFSGDEEFVKAGAISWAHRGNVDKLNSALKAAIGSDALMTANFLIPDFPEFFRAASIPQAKRFEQFNPDIKLDNLAVRMNNSDAARNQAQTEIFRNYPFKYEMVNVSVNEDALKRNGFQWILGYFRAPEGNLKEILGYRGPHNPGGPLVYKFYFRQLYSGEIYLGPTWDAQQDYNTALKMFIENLKANVR
jgi:hypothetical protein